MKLSRRTALSLAAASAGVALLPPVAHGAALAERIAEFTGGAAVGRGRILLQLPDLAENGARVAVTVDAPGASEIMILATQNPEPRICTLRFGPNSGSQLFSTRIRLAQSQEVIALVRWADGSFGQVAQHIEVTIGGCIG
jgi:sulfur-oxidizing protein SoxY